MKYDYSTATEPVCVVEEGRVESYRDLRLYKSCFALQQEIFEMSKCFPQSEIYALTDQLRRASRAVETNIAEAWQKRRYPAHFLSKLTDADAEIAETEHWLSTALECGYLKTEDYSSLATKVRQLGRSLGSMIQHSDSFCKKK